MRYLKKAFGAVAGVVLGGVVGAVGGSAIYTYSQLDIDPEASAFFKGAQKITQAVEKAQADALIDPNEAAALVDMLETDPDVSELMSVSENIMLGAGGLALAGGVGGALLFGRKKKDNALKQTPQ